MAEKTSKPDPKPDDDPTTKTYTKAEVEDLVEARLKRERAKYADYDDLKAKAKAADEAGGKDKGEVEKLTEQIGTLQKKLDEESALRLRTEVAAEKGLTPAHIKRLTGTTRAELEDNADDLLADFPIQEKKDDQGDGKGGGSDKRPPSRKPEADLKGGIDPDDGPTETNPAKLADSVPRL